MTDMTTTHEMAKIFIARYGAKAALEIRKREQQAQQSGMKDEAQDWSRVRQSLEIMRGPPAS